MELELGASFDTKTTSPIRLKGVVKSFCEGWGVYKSDLVLYSVPGVDIVITSKHIGFIDPQMFRDLGSEPSEAEIVVCKLGYLTAPQRTVARRSIMALSKGSSNEDLRTLPFRQIKHPLYPLDLNFEYVPEDHLIIEQE